MAKMEDKAMKIIPILTYLGIGTLFHVLFVGSHFDWQSAWTWLWLFGWPLMCGLAVAALSIVVLIVIVAIALITQ